MYPQPVSSNPRKRPAPGTAPAVPVPQMQHRYGSPSSSNDIMRWHDGADGTAFVPGVSPAVNPYSMMAAQHQQPPAQPQQQHQPQHQQPQQHHYGQAAAATPNNVLARRQANRALVPTAPRSNFDASNDPWSFVDTDPSSASALLPPQQSNNAAMSEEQSVEALEELALKAKQEATVKRKQIPPFVQKLSSFLDEEKNVELIRWSDKGDSFVVLDEDEFAKTLIPELFKHNNYASFVRQLNMYGFHKRVGLSDNSMRASERKNKSPSEYSNPYFRRGHPNLLWLINKPKSGGKKKPQQTSKANAEGEAESEEDTPVDEPLLPERVSNAAHPSRVLPAGGDLPMQAKYMTIIRDEVQKIREQQKVITTAIDRLQRDNSNLYSQAAIFQEQHDRHQNSINAILNFLANVFRKTLEDQNGTQNVNELFANIIPGVNANNTMPQGSVVDLGDFFQGQSASNPVGQPKRARGLLPPIPGPSGGRASTVASTPSANATPQPFGSVGGSSNTNYNHPSGTVEELFDTPDNNSPEYLAQELRSNPQESMMKIIHDTNANSTTGLDLPEVVANTPATMTSDQRQQILSNMMAQGSATPSEPVPGVVPQPPVTDAAAGSDTTAAPGQSDFSLSPIIGSNPRPPQYSQLVQNNNELEALRRLSQDHDNKIHQLQNMLVPLSPSGRIPDLDGTDLAQNYFGSPGAFDMDNFINEDAFGNNSSAEFPDVNFDTAGNDFNFGLLDDTAASAALDHLTAPTPIKRAGSSHNTPSPSGTEEIFREDFEDAVPEAKRQRLHD